MRPPLGENATAGPRNVKRSINLGRGSSALGLCMKERRGSRDRDGYLYTHVHSSRIHNSPKLEATQVSAKRRTDKQSVGYILQ